MLQKGGRRRGNGDASEGMHFYGGFLSEDGGVEGLDKGLGPRGFKLSHSYHIQDISPLPFFIHLFSLEKISDALVIFGVIQIITFNSGY